MSEKERMIVKKLQILQKIIDNGVVAVLRGDSADQVFAMAEAAIAGGIKVIEVTLTVPGALQAIEKLSRMYSWKTEDPDKFAVIGSKHGARAANGESRDHVRGRIRGRTVAQPGNR